MVMRVFFWLFALLPLICVEAVTTLPQVGTAESIGKKGDVEVEVKVQSPSAQETPLQIICLFEYTKGTFSIRHRHWQRS